ncbi:MAG: aspartyl protease family protein [Chloroflexi bacterium]|nr:aspartyl protease family protein [Chloroflexota bacterium]
MGTFKVTLHVGDTQGLRWVPLEALVDTGASYTWVPEDILLSLGLVPFARWEFEIAGGDVVERGVTETRVRLDGETRTSIVVFGDTGSLPLLGAYTLEGFRLAPDPVNRRLIRVRGFAMAHPAWPLSTA